MRYDRTNIAQKLEPHDTENSIYIYIYIMDQTLNVGFLVKDYRWLSTDKFTVFDKNNESKNVIGLHGYIQSS